MANHDAALEVMASCAFIQLLLCASPSQGTGTGKEQNCFRCALLEAR